MISDIKLRKFHVRISTSFYANHVKPAGAAKCLDRSIYLHNDIQDGHKYPIFTAGHDRQFLRSATKLTSSLSSRVSSVPLVAFILCQKAAENDAVDIKSSFARSLTSWLRRATNPSHLTLSLRESSSCFRRQKSRGSCVARTVRCQVIHRVGNWEVSFHKPSLISAIHGSRRTGPLQTTSQSTIWEIGINCDVRQTF
jgi:hypothetical protein